MDRFVTRCGQDSLSISSVEEVREAGIAGRDLGVDRLKQLLTFASELARGAAGENPSLARREVRRQRWRPTCLSERVIPQC